MQPAPDNLASQLRAAVLGSDHQEAERLTTEYCESLREHWMTLSPTERAASPLPKQSLELLKWAREMTIMQRGMAGEHLRMIDQASRYQTARARYLQSAALGSHTVENSTLRRRS
jgi:hypothetical protein